MSGTPSRRSILETLAVLSLILSACIATTAHIEDASGTPRSTTMRLVVGTCHAHLSAEVVETASRITVTVSGRNDSSDDCLDGLTVRLRDPLGQRELVDGATGEVVPARPP
jgi:hypothetical protein